MSKQIIKLEHVSKYYVSDDQVAMGIRDVSLNLSLGEFVAITGESGSGKSTLVNVLSGIDSYQEGEIFLDGEESSAFTINEWDVFRRNYIGFIFQNYHLIDSFTVYENVEASLVLSDVAKKLRPQRIKDIVEKVGLTPWLHQRTAKLSGGQKQRVAIARALAKDAPIIVADEPTGNLDVESGKQIATLLGEIAHDKLVIVVSHNFPQLAPYATRKIKMHDGQIVEDIPLHPDHIETASAQPLATPVKKKRWEHSFFFALKNLFRMPKRSAFVFFVALATVMATAFVSGDFVKNAYTVSNTLNSLGGLGSAFANRSVKRIIAIKDDETIWTDADSNRVNKLINVASTMKYDYLTDIAYPNAIAEFDDGTNINLYTSMFPRQYYKGLKLQAGRAPTAANEVVISSGVVNVDRIKELPFEIKRTNPESGLLFTDVIVTGIARSEVISESSLFFTAAGLEAMHEKSWLTDIAYRMIIDPTNYTYNGHLRPRFVLIDQTLTGLQILFMKEEGSVEPPPKVTIDGTEYTVGFYVPTDYYQQHQVMRVSQEFADKHRIDKTSNQATVYVDDYIFTDFVKWELKLSGYRVIYPAGTIDSSLKLLNSFLVLLVVIGYLQLYAFIGFIFYLLSRTFLRNKLKDFSILSTIGLDHIEIKRTSHLELIIVTALAFIISITAILILRETVTSSLSALLTSINIVVIGVVLVAMMLMVWLSIRQFARYVKKKSLLTEIKGGNE